MNMESRVVKTWSGGSGLAGGSKGVSDGGRRKNRDICNAVNNKINLKILENILKYAHICVKLL